MQETRTEMDTEVIMEYEHVLIGKLNVIDPYYFRGKSPEVNRHTAAMLMRYCFEKYLQWSPAKVRESITLDILRQWHLAGLLKYLDPFKTMSLEYNLKGLAHILYPNEINYTIKDECYAIYPQILESSLAIENQRIAAQEAKAKNLTQEMSTAKKGADAKKKKQSPKPKQMRGIKFPKGFFNDKDGMAKACICLKYAIENYLQAIDPMTTPEEMYKFFGTGDCLKFLRTCKLGPYIADIFDAPVTALHLLLPDEQEREFLFNYYRFWQIYDDNERKKIENRGAKGKREQDKPTEEDKKYVQTAISQPT